MYVDGHSIYAMTPEQKHDALVKTITRLRSAELQIQSLTEILARVCDNCNGGNEDDKNAED